MNLKRSPSGIQDNTQSDLDNPKDYPTLKDLMKEQGVPTGLPDYWDKECKLNPSHVHCLIYDD